MNRTPIRTIQELDTLDSDEIIAGYHSGRALDDEPGDNHSLGFWHGWRNGVADRTGNLDQAQRELASAYVADQRSRA